jgi:PIN domain nuclease of toxin-antitoxin system
MKFILDTCAIIWAVADEAQIPSRCRTALTAPDSAIFVSPISAAEIACAVERGRLTLDRHWKRWFRHFIDCNGWEIVPVDLDIIEEAYSLPGEFHADPADRIIVATARRCGLVAVTADRKILEYPHVDVLWENGD